MDNPISCSNETVREQLIAVEGFRLTYTLYRSKFKIDGRRIFSVKITLADEVGAYDAFACDITRNRSRAFQIYNLLCKGTVTPCTLNDILEDIL